MQLYIENLIYTRLDKSNVAMVANQMRKLDWDDPETSSFAIKCMSSVWNVNFLNILYVAQMLVKLNLYQESAVVKVLDSVLEDIRLGMEMNTIEFNQRRISVIKFFAECFNFRLVDLNVLFNVLYSLITFGINPENPLQSPLDPPENLMRMRLMSIILNCCGSCLTSGQGKSKLECFIYFYQVKYIFPL